MIDFSSRLLRRLRLLLSPCPMRQVARRIKGAPSSISLATSIEPPKPKNNWPRTLAMGGKIGSMRHCYLDDPSFGVGQKSTDVEWPALINHAASRVRLLLALSDSISGQHRCSG